MQGPKKLRSAGRTNDVIGCDSSCVVVPFQPLPAAAAAYANWIELEPGFWRTIVDLVSNRRGVGQAEITRRRVRDANAAPSSSGSVSLLSSATGDFPTRAGETEAWFGERKINALDGHIGPPSTQPSEASGNLRCVKGRAPHRQFRDPGVIPPSHGQPPQSKRACINRRP